MKQTMKKATTVHRMLTAVLAIAVSPLCLLAANYYTINSAWKDVFASKDTWMAFDGTAATGVPSSGNQYWVVSNCAFKVSGGGVFGGDSLALGLPPDMSEEGMPSCAANPTIRLITSDRYTIGDFRLYSGTIHVQNNSTFDPVIAGTSTVYCTSRGDVTLTAYYNAASSDTTRRSINLAAKLKIMWQSLG